MASMYISFKLIITFENFSSAFKPSTPSSVPLEKAVVFSCPVCKSMPVFTFTESIIAVPFPIRTRVVVIVQKLLCIKLLFVKIKNRYSSFEEFQSDTSFYRKSRQCRGYGNNLLFKTSVA